MRIECPYRAAPGLWLRGNLHAHTTESDGASPPEDVIAAYSERGYDFLAISDHDLVTDLAPFRERFPITLIHADEVGGGPHTLAVGIRDRIEPRQDRQAVISAANAQGGLAILNHPNWGISFSHWDQDTLESLSGYAGIEIYNAVIDWLEGSSLATDRWDRLISAGKRCWGFANDDSHRPEGIGRAWVVTDADDRSVESILSALKSGRFYASTGVTIDSILWDDGQIHVSAPGAQRVRFVARHGAVRGMPPGPDASYTIQGDEGYVRVECYGAGDSLAWTQPFFVQE